MVRAKETVSPNPNESQNPIVEEESFAKSPVRKEESPKIWEPVMEFTREYERLKEEKERVESEKNFKERQL